MNVRLKEGTPASLQTAFGTIVLLLIVLCMPVSAEMISIDYTFERPTVRSVTILDRVYDRVTMTKAPNFGNAGEPALPARGVEILLPFGSDISDVEIITSEKVLIGRGYDIEPVGRPYPLSADPATILPPTQNESIYKSNNPFPHMNHRVIDVQSFRGYRYVVIRLHPVEHIPASGELYYYPNMQVNVNTDDVGKAAPLFRGIPGDEAAIALKVDNPGMINSYSTIPKRSDKSFDLLIITINTLADYFQPLADYHNTNGIATEIHTIENDIGSTDPTDVRNYIRDEYLNDGIQYVIIGGDDDIIPAVDLYVASWDDGDPYYDYDMPGDIYFGCLDGTYNYDGDSQWGEPTDGEGGGDVDLVAEVYVGRFAAGNVPEVYTSVLKTIAYLNSNDPYLNNVVLAGENLAFGGFGEYGGYSLDEIIDISSAHGYTTYGHPSDLYDIHKLYDLTYTGNDWPQSEIVSRINSGVHIVNHYGHCNTSWALKMTTADVSYFTNDDYCLIYSQGCYAGCFDDAECWAEYAHVKTDAGAFALVMNARYGWGDYGTDGPSQRFDREFFDAIYNPAEAKPQLGIANQDSKEDNLYRIDEGCMRWCYYQLTLFGDPTIAIKDVKGVTFEYPNGIPTIVNADQTTGLDVIVHGIGSGIPLSGSGLLHYKINDGEYQTASMSETKANNYFAELPAISCEDELLFYVSAEETTNGRFYDPDSIAPRSVIVMADIDTLFEDDFETDKGWVISDGLWARGIPNGMGGNDLGYPVPDPTEGCNGPNVYGYNLNGDYQTNMQEMHLTSPAIDCSGKMNVHLSLCRWLGVGVPTGDHAYIRISTNGTDWTDVWTNSAIIADREWVTTTFDISDIADDQSTVYLRWTMGTSDFYTNYCGWNIDDVRVVAYQCKEFICGDINADETVNIFDITGLIAYLYLDGPAPDPLASADVNNDGTINIFDVTYLITFLYLDGPDPVCP